MIHFRRLAGALLFMAALAAGAEEPLHVELNRLEPAAGGCRVYLVLENPRDHGFESLKLDLVFFDQDGVIARRMAVEAAPLRRRKTTVKLFDIPELPCPRISRILLNDVLSCETGAEPLPDCVEQVRLSSRAGVDLIK